MRPVPPRDRRAEGEEGIPHVRRDTKILTRPQQAGKRHRPRTRPGTRPGRSDSRPSTRLLILDRQWDQDWDYNQASLDEAAARLERLQAAAGRPDRAAAGSGAVAAVRAALASDLDVPAALRRGIFEIAVVLDDLTGGGVQAHFGTSIEGRRLQASDLDWSYGSGPVLRGPAEYLALVLCGRTVPEGRLEGKPL